MKTLIAGALLLPLAEAAADYVETLETAQITGLEKLLSCLVAGQLTDRVRVGP